MEVLSCGKLDGNARDVEVIALQYLPQENLSFLWAEQNTLFTAKSCRCDKGRCCL